MSVNLSNVLVKKFEKEVKQKVQEMGELRNTVRLRDAKGAQIVQFNLMGRSQAQLRGAVQTQIPTMDVTHTARNATVKRYVASELTDIFLNNEVGFDERSELQSSIIMAMGRQLDQIIIDALNAESSPNATVANNISGSTDDLTLAALQEAALQMDADGVPSENRTFLVHPHNLHHLLASTTVTSSDFNSVKALVRGDLDTFYGFKFIKIGTRDEGGLTIDGSNDRTCLVYQKDCVGLALNMDIKVTMDWEPSYGAHRVTGYLSAGAVVIDTDGLVKVTCRES